MRRSSPVAPAPGRLAGLACGAGRSTSEHARALRAVLVVALDRETLLRCLGASGGRAWSGTLYARAAEAALGSDGVWRRVREAVDLALAPWIPGFRDASTEDVEACLASSAEVLGMEESAAAVWCALLDDVAHTSAERAA